VKAVRGSRVIIHLNKDDQQATRQKSQGFWLRVSTAGKVCPFFSKG